MKKFAILGAVAALATAGGVFAAWTYSEGNYNMDDSANAITIGVEDCSTTGNIGSAVVSGELAGTFVQKAETTYGIDFSAHATKNKITTTYTSNSAADETVTVSYVLSISWKDGYALPAGVTITANTISGTSEVLAASSKAYEVTLSNAWFTIAGELNTKAKYDVFKAAVTNATFTLTVDVTASLS